MAPTGMTEPQHPAGSRGVFRWVFENRRTGRITIAQWPNVELGLFIVLAVVLRVLHSSGSAHTALRVLADVALIAWSADEVVRGVNPFRRALGAAFLVATIINLA
jgi:hypothetical protein